MKKVISSQAAILVMNWVKYSFSLWVSLKGSVTLWRGRMQADDFFWVFTKLLLHWRSHLMCLITFYEDITFSFRCMYVLYCYILCFFCHFPATFVFVFRRRLQDVLIKKNIFARLMRLQKTSSRRLDQNQYNRLGHMSSRRLQNVFKTSSRRFEDIFKTSSRRFEDVFKMSWKDLFKTFSKCIIKLNCSC